MIRFSCPQCQISLQTSDEFVGRVVRCPNCQGTIAIAAPVDVPAPTPAPNWLEDVAKAEATSTPLAPSSDEGLLRKSDFDTANAPMPLTAANYVKTINQFLQTRNRMFWQVTAIICGLLVLIVLSVFFNMWPIWFLVFVVSAVYLIVWVDSINKGITTACPQCKKWWAKVFTGERVIEQKKCYGLVKRQAKSNSFGYGLLFGNHHTYGGPFGSSSSSSWKERVPVIRTTYQLSYECKFCHVQWTRQEVEEVEDFDIER